MIRSGGAEEEAGKNGNNGARSSSGEDEQSSLEATSPSISAHELLDGPQAVLADDAEMVEEAADDPVAVPAFPANPGPLDLARLRLSLEAILFASPESLSAARLSEVTGVSVALTLESLSLLQAEFDREGRPYELREHASAFRLYTKPEYYPFLLRLRQLKKVERLTAAALETLAIVAYRQPVIRAEVEAIRGVQVGPMLRSLLDRKLIRVLGRAEVPGAPLQYGTTKNFLDRFGLSRIEDLPSLKEFKQGRI